MTTASIVIAYFFFICIFVSSFYLDQSGCRFINCVDFFKEKLAFCFVFLCFVVFNFIHLCSGVYYFHFSCLLWVKNSLFFFPFFKKIKDFIYFEHRVTEGKAEKEIFNFLTPQMAAVAKGRPD